MNQKSIIFSLGLPIVLCLTLSTFPVSAAPGITKTGESTVTASALSLVLTDYYLNGCSYQQDAIATHNSWQYTAYYNSNRQVCVARRQLPSGGWQVLTLTDYTQSTNDGHNTISLGIAPTNGTIHLAFDHHDSTLHYRKSVTGVTTNPTGITWNASLFGAVTSQLVPGTTITGLTYPRFVSTPQGDLQFEARLGSSGNGQDYLWEYKCSTGAWTSLGRFISNPNGGNAYINGIHYDKSGRLHVSWVKRDTPDATTNHDLHYIYSTDNGRTWRNNSGTQIGTTGSDPVTIEEPKIRTIPTNSGLINQEAQAIDSQGRVHLLMRKTVNGTNYQFHYWRGTDGVWHETNTNIRTKNWYQRGKIAVGPNDNLYAIMPDLIIGSALASTNWTDWTVINRADENKYHSEPLYDWYRLNKGDGILSVVYQMESSGTLKVLDYQLGVGATPTPTPTGNATPTPTPTPGSGSYVKIQNRATGLYIDGMGRTSNGSNAGQYSGGTSYNQQWVIETAGSYVKIKNRATGLYLDGMGRTSNGSIVGQWSNSSSNNQQWTRETAGSYYKFRNRATGLYIDGAGNTSNGADLKQWSSSTSNNQQWTVVQQ
jgi:hypothetical protein